MKDNTQTHTPNMQQCICTTYFPPCPHHIEDNLHSIQLKHIALGGVVPELTIVSPVVLHNLGRDVEEHCVLCL
eukprot:m.76619 g.76619  ORF g.76619 m.76619 type:complete len:73 (+) comp11890_c0_seq1:1289-1507(+)